MMSINQSTPTSNVSPPSTVDHSTVMQVRASGESVSSFSCPSGINSSSRSGILGSTVNSGKTKEELECENEEMKRLLDLVSVGVKRKAAGKNNNRKQMKMSNCDVNNNYQIRELCKKKIFPYLKIKQPGWERYSDKQKAICQRVVRVTSRMNHISPDVWWKIAGSVTYNDVWCSLVANVKQEFYKQIVGMSCCYLCNECLLCYQNTNAVFCR